MSYSKDDLERMKGSLGINEDYSEEEEEETMTEEMEEILSVTKLNLGAKDYERVPDDLREFVNLESLYLDHNKLTKLENLDTLTKLKHLNAAYNNIKEITGLENLTELEVLDVSNNEIENIDNMPDLPKIKEIWFAYNNITDLSVLKKYKTLEKVILSGNEDIESLKTLKDLPNLKAAYLGFSKIKYKNHPVVQELEARNIRISFA